MSFLETPARRHSKTFPQVIKPLTLDARALNERLLAPDASSRATAESWRLYQQQSAPRQPRMTGVDWRLLKEVTGYTREDLIGFCLDEGLPPISGKLTPHEAQTFRDIVLCNWSVVEGHFSEHWQAREALADLRRMLPWTAGDRELCDGWARVCQGKTAGPADQFYGEDVA